jgi:hypothetical protein
MRIPVVISFGAMLCYLYGSNAVAQTKMDSLIGKHLVEIKEIDSAVYQSKTKGKRQEVITNYFAEKRQEFIVNGITFKLYKFGSFTSHVSPHLLLIANDNVKEVYFMDCLNIEIDIDGLFDFLNTFSNLSSFKIKVLKSVMKEYPD